MRDRAGFWSAMALVAVGIAYLGVVAAGMARAGLARPIVDPVLAVMEVLTLISAPLIVILMAAIQSHARPESKALSMAALGFAIAMAVLTSAVHFVALTAGRQLGPFVLEWPSVWYAAELLAWDVFLGLSLVCAAAAFPRGPSTTSARRAMALTGALCLLGAAGPAIGDMRIQRIGIFGYGVALPLTCLLIARVFKQQTNTRPSE